MTRPTPADAPDDLDRHLTEFFRSKVPTPFPPAPAVGLAEPARTPAAGGVASGRLALAASVAVLGGLVLWASGGFTPGPAAHPTTASGSPGLLKNAEASGAKVFDRAAPTAR